MGRADAQRLQMPRVPTSRKNEADHYLRLFDDILAALAPMFRRLRDTRYSTDTPLRFVTTALSQLVGLGIRKLTVARHDIAGGWLPESTAHLRAAWEVSVDATLFVTQRNRPRLATVFLDMRILRHPYKDMIQEIQTLGPHSDVWQQHAAAMRKWQEGTLLDHLLFSSQSKSLKGRDSRNHWSGIDRRKIRESAYGFFAEFLGELLPMGVKPSEIFVFGVASRFAHGDPGALPYLLREGDHFPPITPGHTADATRLITALTPVPALLMIPTIARHLRNASYSEQALQYAARYKSLLWQGGNREHVGVGH